MDRKIEHKSKFRRKHILYVILGGFVLIVVGCVVFADRRSSLRVDDKSMVVADVRLQEFNDYIRINGVVKPISTVQLTPLEAGIVDVKNVEEGAIVHKGQVILRLSNPQLNIQILESEASLAEKENFLRNTRVQMEQEKLNIRKERLQLEMDVNRKRRKFEQCQLLFEDKLISQEEFVQSKEEYELSVNSSALLSERQVQDSIFRALQINNMELNLRSMQLNMKLVRQRIENLEVKSMIDGELGLLNVVLGQSVVSGQKVGQINDLSGYKLEAVIDEYYIDRVHKGLRGRFERAGESYDVEVVNVFPEVRDGKFRAWLYFDGDLPNNIRSGQTYYINLQLGSADEGLVVPRGMFYQSTAGLWIYVVRGSVAERRSIRIGRQNPQYYEVLEGLNEGEQVIISSYESYGDSEVLKLK